MIATVRPRVEAWLADHRDKIGSEPRTATWVYEDFCDWSQDRGEEPLPLPTWGRQCEEFFDKLRKSGRVHMRLKESHCARTLTKQTRPTFRLIVGGAASGMGRKTGSAE